MPGSDARAADLGAGHGDATEEARFLGRAAARLKGQLYPQRVAEIAAHLATGFFGDHAVVHLAGPQGVSRATAAHHTASHHVDDRIQESIAALLEGEGDAVASRAAAEVLVTGEPIFMAAAGCDLLDDVPERLPDASRRYVRSMLDGARHLADLVEDVLSLHRHDDAPQPLDLSDMPVADVIQECATMLRARAAGLRLEVTTPAELSQHTDRSKLRQILINLMDNAVKFTRRGAVMASAEIRGDRVVFTVTDTGDDIDPAEIPHLFEPFWRGSRPLTSAPMAPASASRS